MIFCNGRLYYRIFNKDYGSSSPSIDISHLQTKLDMYNQEQAEGPDGKYTAMTAVDDGSPIIVINDDETCSCFDKTQW